jgi:hypothetical protein
MQESLRIFRICWNEPCQWGTHTSLCVLARLFCDNPRYIAYKRRYAKGLKPGRGHLGAIVPVLTVEARGVADYRSRLSLFPMLL